MKFRCERDVLADVLATAGRAATGRTGTLPVLSGVRLDLRGDHLQVTGTDLELTIDVDVTVAGEADGTTVLPARLTADIVRSLSSGAVSIEVDHDDVHISSGRSQFQVRPLSADDFPPTRVHCRRRDVAGGILRRGVAPGGAGRQLR